METPNSIVKNTSELDILINQYYVAVDLYKHEDALNWSKVNHLLYITGGFGAVFGFFMKNNLAEFAKHMDPLKLLAIVGIAISLAFFITLNAGVTYLQNRKQAVLDLDKKLKEMGGYLVMTCDNPIEDGVIKKSPTRWLLRILPLFITAMWVLILLSRIF